MAITSYYVRKTDDPEAMAILKRLKLQGYSVEGLTVERVFWLEGNNLPIQPLLPLLVNPLYEQGSTTSMLNPKNGPIIEIGYQRAVTDPETPSILDGAKALGVLGLTWARLSQRFQFHEVNLKTAREITYAHLFNPVVQMIIPPGYEWGTLQPTGVPDPVRTISLAGLDNEQLMKLSNDQRWFAPLSQIQALQQEEQRIGRPLTDCEVEIVVQSWCDHCFHTTWKGLGLFQRLKEATRQINHPLIVSVFSDNAGGIKFYEGLVIFIKGETHNFPSSIATFGGIATKHGGIIRDALGFGLGGYPIGGTTIMGTMDPRILPESVPKGALHPLTIVQEAIRGTAYYCNPMGIPMMLPLYRIHPHYPKCFALGHTVGIIPEQYALKNDPLPGDVALLIGGRTGRDGIHGATVSSSQMSHDTVKRDAAAVQIGHPITERGFMTAIPLLRDNGCIRTITDLGAGGISCAVGEMGAKTGIEIHLERVLLKDASLACWEILVSESQERMLIAVPKEKLSLALDILHRYNVEAMAIGRFTDTHRFVAFHNQQKVVDLKMGFLWEGCPIDPIEVLQPTRKLLPVALPPPTSETEWKKRSTQVISHFHCCDQSLAGFQFDSTVQGRTAIGPYAGIEGNMPTNVAVYTPLRGKPYGLVFTAAYNPFFGELEPTALGRLMTVEAITKAIALGVNPKDIVLCDNVYTPKVTPEAAWDLKALTESFIDFSVAIGIPFVSGKDSSSGTFTQISRRGRRKRIKIIDVPPTFVCSTLCRVPDVGELITKPFKKPGNDLILVGRVDAERLGGSVYLDCHGQRGSNLPDYGMEWNQELVKMWEQIHLVRKKPIFQASSAIGEGGIFLRLFEMALGGNLGAKVDLRAISDGRLDGNLFGEFIGSFLFEIEKGADPAQLFKNLPFRKIGEVTAEPALHFTEGRKTLFTAPVSRLESFWGRTFKEVAQ